MTKDLTILIASEVRSFYMNIIKEKLTRAGYKVTLIGANVDEIYEFHEKLGAILIYGDEKLAGQHNALVYLKDKAVEEDVPVFVIGDHNEIKKITSLIPKKIISGEFLRPIDILNVINTITQTVENNTKLKRILVVDDSGLALRTVKEWLEHKYNVYLANSGAMAIKSLSINKPDLVLLDYDMPICDGKTVLEMIRAEMEFKDVPVIFLTNMDSRESIMSVQNLKPDGYLLKSMEPSKIISEINAFFIKRKAMSR